MKAVRIHSFGGPQVLSLEDVPWPQTGAREVLVQVAAAGVNPIDSKIRTGERASEDQLPLTLGCDISGRIAKCGAQVSGLKEGDEVFAMLGGLSGGYAQYVAVEAADVALKPDSLDHAHAAAVPLAATTAWQGLLDHGQLKSGQQVLIHGAAGGVGHFAVQLAKLMGARVTVTGVSTDAPFLRLLGADQFIDHQSSRFEEQVDDVDLVFDLIGGDIQSRSWQVLKPHGTLVSTLGHPPQERARAHAVRGIGYVAQPSATELSEISRIIDYGKLRPFVQNSYPLHHAAIAQEQLENQHARGKIVLRVGTSGSSH